jgi:hypothetical protein
VKPHGAHQALNSATSDSDAFAVQLLPDLVGAVDLHVGIPDTLNLRLEFGIPLRPLADEGRISLAGCMAPIRRRGELQNAADRLDPELVAMFINEGFDHFRRRSSSAWS